MSTRTIRPPGERVADVGPPPGSFFEKVRAAFELSCPECGDPKCNERHVNDEASDRHDRHMTGMSAHEPTCSCSTICECVSPEDTGSLFPSEYKKIDSKLGKPIRGLGPVPDLGIVPFVAPGDFDPPPFAPVPDAAPPRANADEYPSPVTMTKPKRTRQAGPPTDHTSPRAAFRTGGR